MTNPAKQILACLLLLCVPLAQAADNATTYNRITFSEQADVEVENDTLVAVMYVQKEGKRTDRLADEVNQIVRAALQQIKNTPAIKVQTLSYRTNPVYHKQSIKGWRVRQAIQLESKNSQLLGKQIGELQSSLNVQSISYKVSKEKQRQHADGLIEIALKRFQERADNITKALGKKRYKLVRVSVSSGHTTPHRRVMHDRTVMATEARSFSPAPAALEAGTQRLTVSVNGEIELMGR